MISEKGQPIIIMFKNTVVMIQKILSPHNAISILTTKCMIIGEWQMNVVALGKLIYRLKVSGLRFSNRRPY